MLVYHQNVNMTDYSNIAKIIAIQYYSNINNNNNNNNDTVSVFFHHSLIKFIISIVCFYNK